MGLVGLEKGVSETQQYKQLGNSVSIPVIEELAKYMYMQLEEFEIYRVGDTILN